MEKPISLMSVQELRDGLAEFSRESQPASTVPLPPGAPSGLTPEQQIKLSSNWAADIMSREPGTWTPAERQAVRAASARVMAGMGY